jgi:hypothetical protein
MSNNERILDGMSVREAIFRCGELQLPYEQAVLLIAGLQPVDRRKLLAGLQTPGTDEYEWYQSGAAEGSLKLNVHLEANVGDPKANDAYKHLSAERRRQVINRKLEDLFGI